MRTIYRTLEFETFYDSLSDNVKEKIKYALNVISEIKVVHSKLVKKLINTEFYELRISVDNEYRVILFTVDDNNLLKANGLFF